MPCNTCGKDSGKFYEGSCPDCLVGRVRELEIANASLLGAIDSAIIETRRLQVIGGDLLRRLEKLERVAQEARRLMSGVHDENQVQTVYYTCGCWTLAEEDAEPPEVKCPGCALQEALVALDGDGKKGGER